MRSGEVLLMPVHIIAMYADLIGAAVVRLYPDDIYIDPGTIGDTDSDQFAGRDSGKTGPSNRCTSSPSR